jgi:hypothetical protein
VELEHCSRRLQYNESERYQAEAIGTDVKPRTTRLLILILAAILTTTLAGCVEREDEENGARDRPVPTPAPTEPETPEPEPTITPDPGENGNAAANWYELLKTDKVYPGGQVGEEILELAERQDEFEELWAWFEFEPDEPMPEINWDTTMVLFAGTGESSGCPLVLDTVEFHEDDRVIGIGASMDVPEDTMCTMDWTPRVFVLALDREITGDGELRATLFDPEYGEQLDPGESELIREGE